MEIKPRAEHGIVYRNVHSFFGYSGWPTVARDEEGVLYAAFSGFRVGHVCPFGKTALCRSEDGGKTWSAPMVVNDTFLDDRDAGILSLGGKKLLLTWFTHPAQVYREKFREWICEEWAASGAVLDAAYPTIPAAEQLGGSYVRVSQDGGMTWGETVKVPVSAPHGPVRMRDGSILYLGKGKYFLSDDGSAEEVVAAYVSRDEGKTWQKQGEVPAPAIGWKRFSEPHALELQSGRLLGMIRCDGTSDAEHFTVYKTTSDDGGRSWTTPEKLDNFGAPPHLMQHSSGAILMSCSRRREPFGQRVWISRDEGETWTEEYVLRDDGPGDDLGYPSTVELPDGSLFTTYYQKCAAGEPTSILWTHWWL